MIGSFRWNLYAGAIGLIGTFLMSFSQNVLSTALLQSFYSFAFLFFFTFLVRWILKILISASGANADRNTSQEERTDAHKGQSVDYSTPADDPLFNRDAPAEDDESAFAPLNPPKLSTKLDQEPEEFVKAIRRMTEE